ncbi:MAG: GNAT family N-acetyltransferase [Candidatus Bipolaricaulis sp.]|nr:GNAT family N-acetyltransferase [Candidatus Bipolaricaulis sp.]
MITLRRMTQGEFEAWQPISIAEYAAEHVRAGNWSEAEAPEEARKAFEHYLPNGLATEGHYVCSIVDSATGEKVGHLWYYLEPTSTGRRVFIADIGIEDPHRRKGYAAAALKVLEKEAAALGAHAIRLHVFGSNCVARRLYEELGYVETDVQMMKEIAV